MTLMKEKLVHLVGLQSLIMPDSDAFWQVGADEIRRLRVRAILRIVLAITFMVTAGQFIVFGFDRVGLVNYAISLSLITVFFLVYKSAEELSAFKRRVPFFFGAFCLALWAEVVMTGGFNSPTIPLLIGIPIAAMMVLPVRTAIGIIALNVLIFVTVALSGPTLEMLQLVEITPEQHTNAMFTNILGAFMMTGFCSFIVANHSEVARQHMQDLIQHEAHQASHDQLSGLGNRNRLQQFFREIGPSKAKYDFLLIDLDGFKSINDTYGHNAGDYVIKAAAARLKEVTEADDVLIRLGGDEFLVVAPTGDTSLKKMNEYGTRLIEIISRPYPANGKVLRIGASIGHARYPIHGKSPSQALSLADKALYVAKGAGKGVCVTFGVAPKIKAQRKSILQKKTA
ncbi:MAG: GGDEF domain-containing protein [Pseudomonadota bacterium]